MALVNFLRFNRHMGAIISDEEYWDVRFRRRLYCDNLHALLSDKLSSRWNMSVVYGAVGYPSVHREVIAHTRDTVDRMGLKQSTKNARDMTIREIARIAFDNLQAAIRRRIDQKLQVYFGLVSEQVTAGQMEHEGKTHAIKNKKILETARAFATRDKSDPLLKAAIDCKAAVFGYDPVNGISAYYLAAENSICGFNYEGFDSIGSGKYASGLSFGQTLNTKTLKMRKAGFEPAEGMYELVSSALLAGDHFKEVGGTMNFVMIDGNGKTTGRMYREYFDETARLTGEIVRAATAGLLERKDAIDLIQRLVLEGESFDRVEELLFRKTTDANRLLFLLRNYKRSELQEIAQDVKKLKPKKH